MEKEVFIKKTTYVLVLISALLAVFDVHPAASQIKKPTDVLQRSVPTSVIPVRAVQPDLQIVDLVFPASFRQSDTINYSFALRNTGKGVATIPVNSKFYSLRINGEERSHFNNFSPRQLGPGESIPFSSVGGRPARTWFPAGGAYTLTIVADPDNQVAESNENNNTASLALTVESVGLPDVAFVSAVVDPANPTTTASFKVRVTITNRGASVANMDGSIIGSPDCAGFGLSTGLNLQPGASRTFELSAPASWYQVGPRTCTVVIGGIQDDADRTNNQGTLSFTVSQ